MYGVDHFDAILNLPHVAILAVGATTPLVVLEEGLIVEQQASQMTLTCDHRAVDGATAADFLQTLRRREHSGVRQTGSTPGKPESGREAPG